MHMQFIKSEKRLCPCCMETHEVSTVLVSAETTYKNIKVNYDAFYEYCENTKILYMNEAQLLRNSENIKHAYENFIK